MPWHWRRVLLPGALACLCACTLISGAAKLEAVPDEADAEAPERENPWPWNDDGGFENIDAGTDAPPACALPARCLTAPAGFEGPFAVLLDQPSGSSNACPTGFVRSWERVGSVDAGAPAAQCTCTCGPIGGTCAVTLSQYDPDNCTGGANQRLLQPGACVPKAGGADSWKTATTARPSCPADASTTLAPLDAGAAVVGCAPSEPAGCAVGACVPPTPQGGRLCVRPTSANGGVCTSPWSVPVLLAQGLDDTRGCSPCTCTANAPTCAFTYTLYDSEDCTGGGSASSSTACVAPGGIDSVKLNSVSMNGTCTPSGGTPVGGVTTAAAGVLCCEP